MKKSVFIKYKETPTYNRYGNIVTSKVGEYLCFCGQHFFRNIYSFKKSSRPSCGCLKRKQNGKSSSPLYFVWKGMMRRCYDPLNINYCNYGKRGISVCKRWHNYINFYNDLSDGYSKGLTLDRWPNKNGNYKPSNVRWATIIQQNTNKNNNVYITHNGETKTIIEWAIHYNLPWSVVASRYHKFGVSDTEKLFKPSGYYYGKKVAQIDAHGNVVAVFDKIKDAAKAIGAAPSSIGRVISGKHKQCFGFSFKLISKGV